MGTIGNYILGMCLIVVRLFWIFGLYTMVKGRFLILCGSIEGHINMFPKPILIVRHFYYFNVR